MNAYLCLVVFSLMVVCEAATKCYKCVYTKTEYKSGVGTDTESGDVKCKDVFETSETTDCDHGCFKLVADATLKTSTQEVHIDETQRGCAVEAMDTGCIGPEAYNKAHNSEWDSFKSNYDSVDITSGKACKCTGEKCNSGSRTTVAVITMVIAAMVAKNSY